MPHRAPRAADARRNKPPVAPPPTMGGLIDPPDDDRKACRPDAEHVTASVYGYRWDRASAAYRRRYPLCVGCDAADLTVEATCVDHIVPIRCDPGRFWDASNWQAACDWHHMRVKRLLETRFIAGAIGEADLRLDSAIALEVAAALRRLEGRGGSIVKIAAKRLLLG